MKLFKQALLTFSLLTGSLLTSVSFANTALSGGVNGTGTIQSAIPMPHKVIDLSFGFDYAAGADLGLRQIYRVESDDPNDPYCGSESRVEGNYSNDFNFGEVGQICPAGTPLDSRNPVARNNASRISMTAAVGYGITEFLEASLRFPYYQDNLSGDVFSGMGDVRASFKLNYPPYAHSGIFELAYLLQFDLPTGNSQNAGFTRQATSVTNNEDAEGNKVVTQIEQDGLGVVDGVAAPGPNQTPHTSNGLVTLMKLLMTLNLKDQQDMVPLRMHLNFGLGLSGPDNANIFMGGGGLEFWFSENVALFYSAETQVNISHSDKHIPIFSYPIYNKLGLEAQIPGSLVAFTVGVGRVTNNKPEADYFVNYRQQDAIGGKEFQHNRYPNLAFFGGINVGISLQERDSDKDGLLDSQDRCPMEAEDLDNFEDEDGCPEFDNDQDGVPDISDKCPLESEDKDDYEDEDGCIDPDDDKDGILDVQDRCPKDAEDKDNFQDEDGCPDLDNDNDGIEDRFDTKCPNTPEDKDGFQDNDGCPELDNDGDGLPDEADKCPNEPETINGFEETDGCPDQAPA